MKELIIIAIVIATISYLALNKERGIDKAVKAIIGDIKTQYKKVKDKPLMSDSKIGSKVEEDFVDAPINTIKETPNLKTSGLMFTICFGIQLATLLAYCNLSASKIVKMSEILYVVGGVALVFGFFGGILLMKNK